MSRYVIKCPKCDNLFISFERVHDGVICMTEMCTHCHHIFIVKLVKNACKICKSRLECLTSGRQIVKKPECVYNG